MHELVENAVNEFKKIKDEPLRVISHLDCDGLTSAGIIINVLKRENKKFVLSIVKQLNEKIIEELSLENYNTIIFADLGSGYIDLIKKYLRNRFVFIFDHHIPEDTKEYNNIIHVNPHIVKYKENFINISGSGITYFFAKKLNERNKKKKNKYLKYLAVKEIMGNMKFFTIFKKKILDDAISEGKILVKYG